MSARGRAVREGAALFLDVLALGLLAGAFGMAWLVRDVPAPGVLPAPGRAVATVPRTWSGIDLIAARPGPPLGDFVAPVAAALTPKYLAVLLLFAPLHAALASAGRAARLRTALWLLVAVFGQGVLVCLAIETARAYRLLSQFAPVARYWAIVLGGFALALGTALPLVASLVTDAGAAACARLGRWTAALVGLLLGALLWVVGARAAGPPMAAAALVSLLLVPGPALRSGVDLLLGREPEAPPPPGGGAAKAAVPRPESGPPR
ncbi:MAG: hypothetical protein HZA54_18850 [Planctomycetes bacterium]|nr:hypothetical protein [Planctomycetota bacterium]